MVVSVPNKHCAFHRFRTFLSSLGHGFLAKRHARSDRAYVNYIGIIALILALAGCKHFDRYPPNSIEGIRATVAEMDQAAAAVVFHGKKAAP